MKSYIFPILILLISSCKNESDNTNKTTKDQSKPLNIIYNMADDHAYQAISAYGSEISRLAPPQISIELLKKVH